MFEALKICIKRNNVFLFVKKKTDFVNLASKQISSLLSAVLLTDVRTHAISGFLIFFDILYMKSICERALCVNLKIQKKGKTYPNILISK